jgi:hypothetical protein
MWMGCYTARRCGDQPADQWLLLLLLVVQVTPLVLELTQRVAERMSHHDCFDMTTAAKRITSDVMGHLLYGEDLRGTHWE